MAGSGSNSSDESENESQVEQRVQPQVEEGGSVCRVVIPGKYEPYKFCGMSQAWANPGNSSQPICKYG